MKDAHTLRKMTRMPEGCDLINGKGQFQMVLTFRQGRCTEMYIRFRQWCWLNDINPSDVFNSLIEPITHFLENFAHFDAKGNILAPMNLGTVLLEKLYYRSNQPGAADTPEGKARYAQNRARKIQLI